MKPMTFFQQGASGLQEQKYLREGGGFLASKNLDLYSDPQALEGMGMRKLFADVGAVDVAGNFYIKKGSKKIYNDLSYTQDEGFGEFEEEYQEIACKVNYKSGNGGEYIKPEFGTPQLILLGNGRRNRYDSASIFTDTLVATRFRKQLYPTLQARVGGSRIEKARELIIPQDKMGNSKKFVVFMDIQIPGIARGTLRIYGEGVKITSIQPNIVQYKRDEKINGYKNWVRSGSKLTIKDGGVLSSSGVSYENVMLFDTSGGLGCIKIECEKTGDNPKMSLEVGGIGYAFQFLGKKGKMVKESDSGVYVAYDTRISYYTYHKERSGEKINETETYAFVLKESQEIFLPDDASPAFSLLYGERRIVGVNKMTDSELITYSMDGELLTKKVLPGVELVNGVVCEDIIYLLMKEGKSMLLMMFNGHEVVKIFDFGKIQKNQIAIKALTQNDWLSERMLVYKGGIYLQSKDKKKLLLWKQGKLNCVYDGAVREMPFIYDGQILISDNMHYWNIDTEDELAKSYQNNREIRYPVVLNQHQIQKEPYELVCSYLLPSPETKIEAWIALNTAHFRTFRFEGEFESEVGEVWTILGTEKSEEIRLHFLERNGEEYTFILSEESPMPVLGNGIGIQKYGVEYLRSQNHPEKRVKILELHHFKKIADFCVPAGRKHEEGYQRITQLNYLLNAPEVYSLQLMIRGIVSEKWTPKLYTISLHAEQKNKG